MPLPTKVIVPPGPILCRCGCGAEVPRARYPSRQRWFINTHNTRGTFNGNYKGGKVALTCSICGATFYDFPSHVNRRTTCGLAPCLTRQQSQTTTARGVHKIRLTCGFCGAAVYRFPSGSASAVYCNMSCKGAATRGLTGPLASGWKGGGLLYRSTQVRIRDQQRCVVCEFDLLVEVHHITPRHKGGTDDFSNLITVCPNHHRLAHLRALSLEEYRRTDWEPDGFIHSAVPVGANR